MPTPGNLEHELSRQSQGPQRTLHVILWSLVSRKQHWLQTNRARPVPAAGKQKTLLARGWSPFQSAPDPGYLGCELSGQSHSPQRTLNEILGSLVRGTQHQFQTNCDRTVTAGARTQEPCLTSSSSSFWLVLVYLGFEYSREPHSSKRRHQFQAL